MNFYKAFSVFILFGFSTILLGNDCLMKCDDFVEVLLVVEKSFQYAERKDDISRFRKWMKNPKYQFAADTIYSFAKDFFSKKLPDSLLCKRVGISPNYSFAGLYGNHPSLSFTFNFRDSAKKREYNYIDFRFSFDLKTKEISYYRANRNFWLPDCKNYPDSCQFKISNINQASNVLKEKEILSKKYYHSSSGERNRPFHFNFPKKVNDDCMMEDYLVNMYNGEVVKSEIYQRRGCRTLAEKVKNSDLVIQGEVRNNGKGVLFDGDVFTIVEIEVQKVFKGKVDSPVIESLSLGGEVGDLNVSWSHGSVSPGAPGYPSIMFLKKETYFKEKQLSRWDSLTLFPLYITNFESIPVYGSEKDYYSQIEKLFFQKIEEAAGQNRVIKQHPENKNKTLIAWLAENRMDLPDRSLGLGLYNLISLVDEENYLPIEITIGNSNRHSYLKNWNLRVSYNSEAFGKNLISTEKLKYEILRKDSKDKGHRLWYSRITDGYDVEFKEDSENSFLIHFRKNEKDRPFLQVRPSGKYGIGLVNLKFPILNDTINSNIKIEVVGEPIIVDLKTKSEMKYDYIYCSHEIIDRPRSFQKAIISDFFPKKVEVGDTVTIHGQFLESAIVSLFGQKDYQKTYGKIPKWKILEKTENKIVFVVPKILEMSHSNKGRRFKPISGEIYLSKGVYGSLTRSIEDLEIISKN